MPDTSETDRLGLGGNNPPNEAQLQVELLGQRHAATLTRVDALAAATDRAEAKFPVIESDEVAEAFTDQIKQIDEAWKALEGGRTEALAPIDVLRAATHNFFKRPQDRLADLKRRMADRLNAFQKKKADAERERRRLEAERARQEAERQRQERLEAERAADEARRQAEAATRRAEDDAAAQREAAAATAAAEEAERAARMARRQEVTAESTAAHTEKQAGAKDINKAGMVRGSYGGQASLRKTFDFKVVKPNLVPKEYLMVDEGKIRRAINQGGVTAIRGVQIFEVQNTVTK